MATIAIACNALLVLFMTWQIAWGRISVFSPLSFFAAGFAYLHVFRAWLLAGRLPGYLADGPFEFGLAVSFLSFSFLLIGYHFPQPYSKTISSPASYLRAPTVFRWSCFFLFLYALSSAYLIAAHEGIWNWLTAMKTSLSEVFSIPGHAQWYAGANLFVAAYLLGWIAFRLKPSSYKLYFRALLVWTLVVRFFFQALIAGSRGRLVESGILLTGPLLCRNRSRLVAVTIWLAMMSAGLLGELMGETRGQYGFGHDKLLPTDMKKSIAFDQEYSSIDGTVYHYTRIYSAWKSGKWGYGSALPETFWQLIPRKLWPGRPFLLRNVLFPERREPIEEVLMIDMPGSGPAPGGIAWVFSDFGLAFILFWVILGLLFRRVDVNAATGKNLASIAIALSFAGAVVHLSTQSLPSFYNWALWYTAPVIVAIQRAKRGPMAVGYQVKPLVVPRGTFPLERLPAGVPENPRQLRLHSEGAPNSRRSPKNS